MLVALAGMPAAIGASRGTGLVATTLPGTAPGTTAGATPPLQLPSCPPRPQLPEFQPENCAPSSVAPSSASNVRVWPLDVRVKTRNCLRSPGAGSTPKLALVMRTVRSVRASARRRSVTSTLLRAVP